MSATTAKDTANSNNTLLDRLAADRESGITLVVDTVTVSGTPLLLEVLRRHHSSPNAPRVVVCLEHARTQWDTAAPGGLKIDFGSSYGGDGFSTVAEGAAHLEAALADMLIAGTRPTVIVIDSLDGLLDLEGPVLPLLQTLRRMAAEDTPGSGPRPRPSSGSGLGMRIWACVRSTQRDVAGLLAVADGVVRMDGPHSCNVEYRKRRRRHRGQGGLGYDTQLRERVALAMTGVGINRPIGFARCVASAASVYENDGSFPRTVTGHQKLGHMQQQLPFSVELTAAQRLERARVRLPHMGRFGSDEDEVDDDECMDGGEDEDPDSDLVGL